MLPVLLQDPVGHAGVTAATALSEGGESWQDKILNLQVYGQGSKVVDGVATCRLGFCGIGPLNMELLGWCVYM